MSRHLPVILILLACVLLPTQAKAQSMLFESDELIKVTLETDFSTLFDNREEELQQLAVLSYEDEEGEQVSQELKVRLRGNFRKKHCEFPPIRLNFAKEASKNTIFDGEDKLKLVTHCKDWEGKYEQYVLLEYLTYRLYNELTDLSFRVRLVHITYEDSSGKRKPLTRYGFLIEDVQAVAQRNDGKEHEQEGLHQEAMDGEHILFLSLFQYMIGNTDWSVPVLHNIRLIVKEENPLPFPVPYDFDFSGFVNATYASPSPALSIESVRQRLYRGYCRPEEELLTQVPLFQSNKDRLYELVEGLEPLTKRRRKDATGYLNTFYNTINSEKGLRRAFVKNCRGL